MIDLHYAPTMNGHKVAIMLEEVGLPYRLVAYNLLHGDHLGADFHALNPNHKIPVIVDHAPGDGGPPLTVFESGAILFYLAETTGRRTPRDCRRREGARQWLMWQAAGLGPMHGQANHFIRYAPAGQDYAVERYSREARRLVAVLETRLGEADYLAEEYSIADIASWAFVAVAHTIGIDVADYPAVARWQAAIDARPAVMRVVAGEQTATPAAMLASDMKLTDEQWSNVFGQRMLDAASQPLR